VRDVEQAGKMIVGEGVKIKRRKGLRKRCT